MTLTPGARIGPYEITAHIGSGGMGEVYRARDTRLKRDVAVKVLPASVAAHPDRIARFQREAELLAALNHPNIANIHGLEDSGPSTGSGQAVLALVMELVDGATLADRIAQPPHGMPPREIVVLARQIVSALAAAHERGIVHRDLKPANIKITASGQVKLLDFGLAKEFAAPAADSSANTITDAGLRTEFGAILGTAAYMSPEQALGEPVDARTDLFSLGAVLYEMATGRRAFEGPSSTAVMNAVLHKTPPSPRSLNRDIPPELDRVVVALLEKDRLRRPQHAFDVGEDLRRLEQTLDGVHASAGTRRPRSSVVAASIAAVATVMAIAASLWIWSRPPKPSAARAADYVQITRFANSATSPSLSQDGRMVTFIQGSDPFFGPGQIFVKALPDGEPVQLTNDSFMKMSPAFSPDGSQIVYTIVTPPARWDTWVVSTLGGTPRPWLRNAAALSWIGDKRIMFSEITDDDINMRVTTSAEDRRDTRAVYSPVGKQAMAHRSSLSPDGKSVLIVEMNKGPFLPCRVVPFDGSSSGRQVGPSSSCTSAAWSPDGHWMYVTSNATGEYHIWRQRFPDGTPEQITSGPSEEEGIAVAPDGSLWTSLGGRQQALWVHDDQGERVVSREGYAFVPSLPDGVVQPFSADGHTVLYLVRSSAPGANKSVENGSDLWMTNLDTGHSEAVLPGFNVRSFDVSRDGNQVAVAAFDKHGTSHIWVARLDKQLPPRQIWTVEADSPRYGAQGEIFCRATDTATRRTFIYRIKADGSEPQPASSAPVLFFMSASADGQWLIASAAPEVPTAPIRVFAFPSAGGSPIPICTACHADWTFDGSALVVRIEGQARTLILPIEPGRSLPRLPGNGLASPDDLAGLTISATIDSWAYPGRDAHQYLIERGTIQRNIYRIPIQ